MIRASLPGATSLGLALAALTVPASAVADDVAAGPAAQTVVAVDFDRIPRGTMPPLPNPDQPPAATADPPAAGVALQKVVMPPRRKRFKKAPNGLAAKTVAPDVLALALDHPEVAAMYVADPSLGDFAGEAIQPLSCGPEQPPNPLRWETLTTSGDEAQVEVKDLWFTGATCAVHLGATTTVKLAAIAWDGAQPWLYAVRDDQSVTFLLPRTDDLTVDGSVGTPVTVRGGFTRVSLPLGRWGASSFVAHLPSLEPSAPSPVQTKPSRKKPPPKAEAAPAQEPVEVTIELVQTMSEASPTVLVRRSPQGLHASRLDRD
jgi:hypothetical protein